MREYIARMKRLAHDASLWPDQQPLTQAELDALLGGTASRLVHQGGQPVRQQPRPQTCRGADGSPGGGAR